MVQLQVSRSSTGMEIRLNFPCQSNILNVMKLNLNKLFVFQYGQFPGDNNKDVQTYKLDIGVFQTTLLSFCITLSITFLSRIIRSVFSIICPWERNEGISFISTLCEFPFQMRLINYYPVEKFTTNSLLFLLKNSLFAYTKISNIKLFIILFFVVVVIRKYEI